MASNDHKPVYSKSRFPKQIAPGTCRGCHQPVTAKRRKTWCSDACKKKYDPYWVKRAVIERDKHICQICGLDIRAAYVAWRKARPATGYFMQPAWREWFKGKVKEEYDHIIPFCEGGATVVENMRTLCQKCHRERTAQWRKERAKK